MLLTEQEAKQKWCPFALVRNYDAAVNRSRHPDIDRDTEQAVEKYTRCLASGCMAWRTEPNPYGKPTRVHPSVLLTHWQGWIITDENPDANGYVEISPPTHEPKGYCGKIGKPEA